MQLNPFKGLKKHEWALWITSLITVAASNIAAGQVNLATLLATLLGVTALIFVARGDVWGQILSVVFGLLYAIAAYEFKYWGEMITYLGMSAPIALLSVISWLKNPYEKGKNEVKIHRLTIIEKIALIVSAVIVTTIFYFILKAFDTPNLFFSTVSITTSYAASYLMLYRNPYYAVAYGANDIVLIILWVLASLEDISYFPMVICFLMFLINDSYGFASWKIREKKQSKNPIA